MAYSPPITRDMAQEAVDAVIEHGSQMSASKALGIPYSTFNDRYRRAAAFGLLGYKPVLEGFEIGKISTTQDEAGNVLRQFIQQRPERSDNAFALPDGHSITRTTAQVDGSGRIERQWLKTSVNIDHKDVIESIKTAFIDMPTFHNPVAIPDDYHTEALTLWPCNDWHLGMYSWGKEAGENWDLHISEQVIGKAVDELAARSPRSACGVVLVGGDLLHSDNDENRTRRSGNVLQVDGRWQKVLQVATRLLVHTVEKALETNAHVIVRVLPGNHDEHSAPSVSYYLSAWFRHDERVTVDLDPSLYWWHRWGKVMFGSTHGHTVKITDMPSIMAHRKSEDWGQTKFRYVHGFHLHHSSKYATEGGGVISEVHQAPIPQDAWHYGAGFLSGRSLQSITYHRDLGEVSRVRVAIVDG